MPEERSTRGGDRSSLLVAAAGVTLLAAMFLLPWFGPSAALERSFDEADQIQSQFGGPEVVMPDVEDNAWEAFGFVRFVLLAAALFGIGLAAMRLTPRPRLTRLRAAALTTVIGIAATALVLYHLVNPPGDSSREIGVFAGLLASGGVALGGWIVLDNEERPSRRPRPAGTGVSPQAAPPGRARSATRTRSRSSSG